MKIPSVFTVAILLIFGTILVSLETCLSNPFQIRSDPITEAIKEQERCRENCERKGKICEVICKNNPSEGGKLCK